jgi:hypothetical protein
LHWATALSAAPLVAAVNQLCSPAVVVCLQANVGRCTTELPLPRYSSVGSIDITSACCGVFAALSEHAAAAVAAVVVLLYYSHQTCQ